MVNHTRLFGAWAITAGLALSGMLTLSSAAQAQHRSRSKTSRRSAATTRTAFDRGYLIGYNDGYNTGKKDQAAQLERNVQRSRLYLRADHGYLASFGSLIDYQDGYRLGFEMSYIDGYYGRLFDAMIPPRAQSATTALNAKTETVPLFAAP
jgi:hypothetical protein